MKELKKAQMGIIAVLALMLVSMKRRLPTRELSSGITTLALAGIVLLVAAGSVSALDCPAPGNALVTSSCKLAQNYTVPAGEHGYIIGADNIVIDGDGHYISGSIAGDACFTDEGKQPAGIYNYNATRMYGYSNVTIKNLEVKNFCTGILVRGATATTRKVEDNTILRCNIHDNGDPTIEMNTFGIHFFKHVYNSTIDECEIHHNTGGGTFGMACDSGGMGIRLKVSCNHNDIIQNYIHDNVHSGIFTKGGCKFVRVAYNNITGNGLSATTAPCGGITMRCKNTNNWTVEMNNITDNFGPGMYVGGGYNTIRYNTVMDCKDVTGGDLPSGYAIEVGRSDGATGQNELYNNTFCNNNAGVADISVCGAGSGANNIGDDNAADTCTGCSTNGNNILYPYTCDNKVSAYFDFDGDGYYSDDPANCACGIIGGAKCACCNPGMFNSTHAGVLNSTSPAIVWLTPGDDINDCDPSITSAVDWYCDGDNDGYISIAVSGSGAPGGMPSGCQLTPGDDCNDGNEDVNPGATEVCNGIDDDCDGDIDEGVMNTYYGDADGDGYGDPANTTEACSAPAGYVEDNTDCDDTNANVNPGATEVCDDGIDNDCDTLVDDADPDCQPCSKPDLVITDIWTELKKVGRHVNTTIIWYNITNNGDTTAGRTYSNLTVDDGAQPRNDRVGKLTPGQTRTEKFTYKGDPHNITVCADCRCVVTESNETNNCLSVTV